MHRDSRIHRVMKAAGNRYQSGDLSLEGIRALAVRARTMQARRTHLRIRRGPKGWDDSETLARLDRLASVLAGGGTVVALDSGMMRSGPGIDELGVSTWRAGAVETATYYDETALHRNPDPAVRVMLHPNQNYSPALYGPSVPVPHADLLRIAQAAFDGADMTVMHSVAADVHRIGLAVDPSRVLDTYRCGRPWGLRQPSLEELCLRVGVPIEEAHNSGNDARHTLDLAVALASEHVRGPFAAYVELERRMEDAHHRLMMHPVRAPGLDALLDARKRTCGDLAAFTEAMARNGKPPRPRKGRGPSGHRGQETLARGD